MTSKPKQLAIFGNMRIDSVERLYRLKDSLSSFGDHSRYDWYLNFRGLYSEKARELFDPLIESGVKIEFPRFRISGEWRSDSIKMIESLSSQYVLIWMEDHLCVSGQDFLDKVVYDMKFHEVELLLYSFFFPGNLDSYGDHYLNETSAIRVFDYDVTSHKSRLEYVTRKNVNVPTYIVSMASIMTVELFQKILISPVIKPIRWPKDAPYDIEQPPEALSWLPLRIGVLKVELFASIDDDHGINGYSLISRGVYPNRVLTRITGTKKSNFPGCLHFDNKLTRTALRLLQNTKSFILNCVVRFLS